MFGYSVSRPVSNKQYFYSIYDMSEQFGCPIESWHTESGPGGFEGVSSRRDRCGSFLGFDTAQALSICEASKMADRVSLSKSVERNLPKPGHVIDWTQVLGEIRRDPMSYGEAEFPGNSGHIHMSLTDINGNNLFARDRVDDAAP